MLFRRRTVMPEIRRIELMPGLYAGAYTHPDSDGKIAYVESVEGRITLATLKELVKRTE